MLSQMFRQLFADNPLTVFPSAGLAVFMVVFALVTVGVLRRRAATYDALAGLPLADEEVRDGR